MVNGHLPSDKGYRKYRGRGVAAGTLYVIITSVPPKDLDALIISTFYHPLNPTQNSFHGRILLATTVLSEGHTCLLGVGGNREDISFTYSPLLEAYRSLRKHSSSDGPTADNDPAGPARL